MSYARNGLESSRYDHSVTDIRICVVAEELNTLKGIVKDLAIMVDRVRQRLDEAAEIPGNKEDESTKEIVKEVAKEEPLAWHSRVLNRLYPYRYVIGTGVVGVGAWTMLRKY